MIIWRKFLLIQLPLALLVLALLAEALGWGLRDVPLRRHDLDRLVLAIDRQKQDAPLLLQGDSITQDVAKSFPLAPHGALANLTTNASSGLIGSAFLLRRYLERNQAPRALLIAATPDFFSTAPAGGDGELYLTSVFRRADEQEQLRRQDLLGEASPRKPAVLDLQGKVGDRLLGLLAPAAEPFVEGDLDPAKYQPEPPPALPGVDKMIAERGKQPGGMTASAQWAMGEICRLSAERGFTVVVARAPLPDSLNEHTVMGDFAGWAAAVQAAGQGCPKLTVEDFNAGREFPLYAFRDNAHLRRPGWSGFYARLLAERIARL